MLGIDKSILSNKYKYNLTDYTNSKLTINANNYFNKIGKNKNIKFHNLVVQNISKNDGLYQLNCINCKNKKSFKSQKIVLACGTLISTKLISDFLDYKEHKNLSSPNDFSSFISKSILMIISFYLVLF